MSPRPLPNTYWVTPGRLLAGEYPGSPDEVHARDKLRRLLRAGLSFFMDLTLPGEMVPYHDLLLDEARALGRQAAYSRHPILDRGVPSPVEMRSILDELDGTLAGGQAAYVHCWGGVGRTGTVVGCYLVRRGLTGDQALRQLEAWWQGVEKRSHFPRSPETGEQVAYIRDWSEA